MSKDVLKFRREAERGQEESRRQVREFEEEVVEAESYAAAFLEMCAKLTQRKRLFRLAQHWISFVREWVLQKRRAERWGERTIVEERRNKLVAVWRALELNRVKEEITRELVIKRTQLLDAKERSVTLWEQKEREILLRRSFDILHTKWSEDESGLQAYKKQKQNTIDMVEHMNNLTKRAELTAEKVQMDQEEMLHRVIGFVKKNRSDTQRRTVA
jgi:hypothetical protein